MLKWYFQNGIVHLISKPLVIMASTIWEHLDPSKPVDISNISNILSPVQSSLFRKWSQNICNSSKARDIEKYVFPWFYYKIHHDHHTFILAWASFYDAATLKHTITWQNLENMYWCFLTVLEEQNMITSISNDALRYLQNNQRFKRFADYVHRSPALSEKLQTWSRVKKYFSSFSSKYFLKSCCPDGQGWR